MNKIVKFLIKYIWQAPLMLAAWMWYKIKKKNIIHTFKNENYTVHIGANKGGVTLGNNIFIDNHYHGEYLALIVAHESGHVKQSKYLGPLYLFIIGIPSIIWAATYKKIAPKKSYYWFYTESWSNKLGGVTVDDNGVLTWIKNKKRWYEQNT